MGNSEQPKTERFQAKLTSVEKQRFKRIAKERGFNLTQMLRYWINIYWGGKQ